MQMNQQGMMMMNPTMMMKNEKVKMTGMEGSGTNWEKIRSQQSDKFSLFVGNLDSMVNEELLSNFFQKWGRLFSVRVMRAKGKGTSRGFGFVTYYHQEDMKAARQQANGQKILENPIRVVRNVPQPSIFSQKQDQVYIKNLNKEANVSDLERVLGEFGEVFSSKIATSIGGESLGYGYLQYEHQESARKAIAQGQVEVKGDKAQVMEIRGKEDKSGNNLYFKNLPQGSCEELTTLLQQTLSPYGHIASLHVAHSPLFNLPFAFVCFSNVADATNVLLKLNNTPLFQPNVNVYIAQAMTKAQRKKTIEIKQKMVSKQNLFMKNLNEKVTVEDVKRVFSEFGTISSVVVQSPKKENMVMNPKYEGVNTQFGYICYSNGNEATKALAEYQKKEHILDLFYNRKAYLCVHLDKERFKQQKKKNKVESQNIMQILQQQMKMMQNPQMLQMMMQMMMPMMNMQHQMLGKQAPPSSTPHISNPLQFPSHFQKPVFGFNNLPVPQPQPVVVQPTTAYANPQQLKENINTFLNLDRDKQRSILGELLYPMVEKLVQTNGDAPKITGMLIDFEVFEVSEILEFLENESLLNERILEAKELIEQTV